MSLQACADMVAKSDPHRFRATMAAPIPARRVLFPIYAFAIEVARAPYVTQEPLIAEMRLQWWRDALDEIKAQGTVRRHEVVTPMAEVVTPEAARLLDDVVAARRGDIDRTPMADPDIFKHYLENTGASLAWAAALCLGATASAEIAIRSRARATALARYFEAVPALLAQGRQPMTPDDADALKDLAQQGLAWAQTPLPPKHLANAVLLEGWATQARLSHVARTPASVRSGGLDPSPWRQSWLLWRHSLATGPFPPT